MKTSLKIILTIILLVTSGINNQANSFMGSIKSCLHNGIEFLQIAPSQSCEVFHSHMDSSLAKHAGINPDDCLLAHHIISGELN